MPGAGTPGTLPIDSPPRLGCAQAGEGAAVGRRPPLRAAIPRPDPRPARRARLLHPRAEHGLRRCGPARPSAEQPASSSGSRRQ
eukprot:215166-Lingulodinium_polyedra.AAC.1